MDETRLVCDNTDVILNSLFTYANIMFSKISKCQLS